MTSDEQGNNILIDRTNEYCLYCGGHLFNRQYRHVEDTYNIGDKITIGGVKNLIRKGFYHIDNCFNSGRIIQNNENSRLCLTDKNTWLNVVIFVKKLEIDGLYDIIIKTTMIEKNFYTKLKRFINEDIVNNIIFIEV